MYVCTLLSKIVKKYEFVLRRIKEITCNVSTLTLLRTDDVNEIFLTLKLKERDGLERFGSVDKHVRYLRKSSFFEHQPKVVVVYDHLQRGPRDCFAHRVLVVDLRRQDGSGS